MTNYIEVLLEETPASLLGESSTTTKNHLFEVDSNRDPLGKVEAEIYYHMTMQILYLYKRARPDIQLPVSFLTTRVRSPDQHDWNKLRKTLQYLTFTEYLPPTLDPSSVLN